MFCLCFGGTSDRLKKFINNTKNKKCETKEEFNLLFEESRDLVFEYLSYYDKKRLSKQRSAAWYRRFIWLFSLIGLSLPIIGTISDNSKFAEYGYGFIMLTAIIFALKNFTGANKGHARYTKTQLKLEKLISIHTLDWQENLNKYNGNLSPSDIENLHKVILRFLLKAYKEILSETDQWETDMKNDENNFFNNHIPKPEKT